MCLFARRKMLDADIRAVRKLKEFLLPDEETDGVGRQRVYKWKNLESSFKLDDEINKNDNDKEDIANTDEIEEQNENAWRKMRYERERFLKEQCESNVDKDKIEINSIREVTTKDKSVPKIITENVPLRKTDMDSFLITKNHTINGQKSSVRGSFLVRDQETLHKLSGLTKHTGSNGAGHNIEMVNVTGSNKSRNFVFATLTAEESEAKRKRKAEEQIGPSTSHSINYMKKPKLQPRREKCFIDRLVEEPLNK